MNQELKDFFEYVGQTSEAPLALSVSQAGGSFIHGPDGKTYLDFISGICVSNLGHGDTDIIQAIWLQARQYLHPIVYGEGIFTPQVQYAKALANVLAEPLAQVYFTNSGSEAIEAAMKIAKKFTGRSQLIACHKAYHGSTHGALSISGDPEAKKGYGPLLPDILHIDFNDVEALDSITEKTAGFVVEPIQGASGITLPQDDYLRAVQNRCNEVGALFILDEIQTGFGRIGPLFAHQHYQVQPDILVLAKALGGGLPLGALVSSPEVLACIQKDPPLGHISTFGGHPVSCAAGLALFNKLSKSNILGEIPQKEAYLRKHLQHPKIQELRGKGLLFGVIFPTTEMAKSIGKRLFKKGLLTMGFLSEHRGLRISPPLNISMSDLEWGVSCFLEAIEEEG